MFDVGGGELLLILLAVVILFGPKQLPDIARKFGRFSASVKKVQRDFRREMTDIQQDIENIDMNVDKKNKKTLK